MILSLGIRPFILSASRFPSSSSGRRMGSLLTLGAAVGVPLALGQVMGLVSAPDVATWYPKLEKPSWTPPVVLFPIIWSTLYFLMGIASHRVWMAGAGAGTLGLYAVQLGLNLAWQPLFFKSHNLKAASYDINALLVVLAITTRQFFKYDHYAGLAMLPYCAFCVFAAALTFSIRMKNGDKVE